MEKVVADVLTAIRYRLDEPLTLDDLASIAMFSKFHFARTFRQVTGVSPRRFLYRMRLQEAKHLLVTTPLSVVAISHKVGYHSVGTFTSRFTASVGVSPTVYRRHSGDLSSVLPDEPPDPEAPGAIVGRIDAAGGRPEGPTYIGLFRCPVPEGRPTRYVALGSVVDWSFQNVPPGHWYVLTVTHARGGGTQVGCRQPMTSMSGPVEVCPEDPTAQVTVRPRPVRPVDPPILAWLSGPLR